MSDAGASRQVLVGGAWLIAARAADRLVGVVSISILTRLLKPVDFGVVAVAGTVVSAIEILSAFGFDWALVRHKDPSRDDLDTAWTLRLLFGLFTLLALTLLGPLAASFYRQAALREVLIAMGASSLLASLENIGTVYFRREFAFHKEFLIRFASKLAGFCVTIAMALRFRSYWALIAGVFAIRSVTVAASYLFHPYRPRLSLRNARELVGFSSWLLFGNAIEYCRQRFGDLYIGRVYGAATNGLFAVAGEIAIVPLTEVAAPINRAAYSKYVEDVHGNRELGPSYLSIASLIWLISLPMAAGTAVVAPEIISLLLGPRFQGAQGVLRWLAIGTAFTVVTANTHYVYWALGHSRVVAGLSLAGAAIIVPMTIVCSHFAGYTGVAIAFACASALLVPINFTFLRRLAGIRFSALWARVWRIALATAVMTLTILLTYPAWQSGDVWVALRTLLGKVSIGACTYVLALCVAWIACGRPEGPERATIDIAHQGVNRCKSYLMRRVRAR